MIIKFAELENIALSPGSLKFPEYINQAYMKCLIHCLNEIEVPDSIYSDVEKAREEHIKEMEKQQRWENDYSIVSDYRLTGMDMEKQGDIYEAIDNYIKAISYGENSEFGLLMTYAHAYERLIVCLHKVKDYEREADFIRKYIAHDLNDKSKEKYTTRLNKLESKIKNSI